MVPLTRQGAEVPRVVLDNPTRLIDTDLVLFSESGRDGKRKPYVFQRLWTGIVRDLGMRREKMNWQRLYATLEVGLTASLFSSFISAFFAFLISGVFRISLRLGDDEAMWKVFLPVMLVLFVALMRFVPKSLRKMGIVSDSSERFGPWFK
ncbi:hypothetical protein [Burkholderia ambifaria]|uniref:hypothetical protein n=1 Tax=Burkholderia ambifaria TaxID=152480 RepID=UPI002FE1C1E8